MLQHAASSRIHLPGPPSKRLLKKRSADAAVGAGNQDCLIFNVHTTLPHTEFGEAYALSCLYSVDEWRELISTEQNGKKISPAIGGGTVSPPGPQRGQSPGRKRPRPRRFSQAVVRREREPPSRADKWRQRPGRSHRVPPALLQVPSLRRPPRRIQFACRASAICGSAVCRTA